uniref:Lipase domain-containing protein n=1 Tax=Glossina brevipalpis TaxID=37001 RepID=A0A1A9W778_9MUSC
MPANLLRTLAFATVLYSKELVYKIRKLYRRKEIMMGTGDVRTFFYGFKQSLTLLARPFVVFPICCGYSDYYLQKNFGLKMDRITGLDPTVSLFAEIHSIVHLDRCDGHFVDTDSLRLYQRLGHVDFYLNGGMDNPDCDGRLQEYMRNKSIKSNYPFIIYQDSKAGCSCYNENGRHICMRIGYHSYEDYRHHYKITIRVVGHEESTSHGDKVGTVSIRLHGKHRKENLQKI